MVLTSSQPVSPITDKLLPWADRLVAFFLSKQKELGIKRQDHAQRIVKHITAKFDGDLHSRLQEFEGLMPVEGLGTLPLTLCVEGNISAGKSTFLEYITNNNEELQQQLGVSVNGGQRQFLRCQQNVVYCR
jgi:polynucleotide 5'-kinase involved in rRNA processing